jgi:hypothetical protein
MVANGQEQTITKRILAAMNGAMASVRQDVIELVEFELRWLEFAKRFECPLWVDSRR